MPLTDNNIVEENLGKQDIICVEDMINQVIFFYIFKIILKKDLDCWPSLQTSYQLSLAIQVEQSIGRL